MIVGEPIGEAQRVARNAASLIGARVITAGALLVWQVLLARQLAPAEYGLYATIAALMAVGAVLPDFGIGVIHVRTAARQPMGAGRILTAALALHIPLAVLAYVAVQAFAALLGYSPELQAVLLLAAVSLLIDVAGTAAHNQLVAGERIGRAAMLSALHAVLLMTAGGFVLAAGGGLWAVYGAVIACGLVRTTAFWAVLWPTAWRPVPRVEPATARRLIRSGMPLGAAAALTLGLMHADKLATTAVLGEAPTGQLMIAFVLVFGLVELLGTTVLVAALPTMSRQAPDGERLPGMLRHLLVFDLAVGLPAAGLLMVVGPAIGERLFGLEYAAGASLLPILGWYVVLHLWEGALAQGAIVQDRQASVLVARAAGLAVNLALILTLLPRLGIAGAAYAMIAGDLVIIAVFLMRLRLPAAFWTAIARDAVRLGPAALFLGATLLLLSGRVPPGASVAAALAGYAAFLAGGALPPEQREVLRRLLRTASMGWGRNAAR